MTMFLKLRHLSVEDRRALQSISGFRPCMLAETDIGEATQLLYIAKQAKQQKQNPHGTKLLWQLIPNVLRSSGNTDRSVYRALDSDSYEMLNKQQVELLRKSIEVKLAEASPLQLAHIAGILDYK